MEAPEIKIETGIPIPEPKRERSTIEIPYTALDTATEIAKAVHEVGGQSCQWDQLGAKLNMAADGGGFRQRVATAKTFGLITYTGGIVTLTPLGVQINDPAQEQAAKVASFLTVPLYKRIYEDFKNGTLPGPSGLETAIVTMGVSPKQKDKARQAFTKSATEAGFFAFGSNRLVLPAIKPLAKSEPVKPVRDEVVDRGAKLGGAGGGVPPDLNPFIKGLLAELPPDKTEWSAEGRKNWLIGAASIFNLIYKPDGAGDYDLSITLKKTSAT
jgi:hypothetical protein